MPKIKNFKKIYTQDQALMQVQDSVAESVQSLTKIPILESNLLTNISIGTTATAVDHGLGRQPFGFIVVDSTANVQVWRSSTPSEAPSKLLMLQASSAATVSLLIF